MGVEVVGCVDVCGRGRWMAEFFEEVGVVGVVEVDVGVGGVFGHGCDCGGVDGGRSL